MVTAKLPTAERGSSQAAQGPQHHLKGMQHPGSVCHRVEVDKGKPSGSSRELVQHQADVLCCGMLRQGHVQSALAAAHSPEITEQAPHVQQEVVVYGKWQQKCADAGLLTGSCDVNGSRNVQIPTSLQFLALQQFDLPVKCRQIRLAVACCTVTMYQGGALERT